MGAHPIIAAMKKLIAQVEALPENEQAEVAELLLAALEEREDGRKRNSTEGVAPEVEAVIDGVAHRHFDALGKLA